jgi:hypothetical protein
MSAEWAVRDEQPILRASTNPFILRAAGTQRVKEPLLLFSNVKTQQFLFLEYMPLTTTLIWDNAGIFS